MPHLERWLARARIAREPGASAEAWLAARYGLEGAPVAAVTLAIDEAPQPGHWLRADPVYAQVERDSIVLHHAAMLAIRPGAAPFMLYTSASFSFSAFRYGEFGGNNGTTTPPGRIGCGAYGASVAVAGFGTFIGAGSGGKAADSAAAEAAASAANSAGTQVRPASNAARRQNGSNVGCMGSGERGVIPPT